MSGGSGNFMHDLFSAPPTVQGSSTPTAQPGTTPAWQKAAQPQVMRPNPYAPQTPANMPPPVTNMGPGVNAAFNDPNSPFAASIFMGATPTVQGSSTPTPANIPPPVTDMAGTYITNHGPRPAPGVNAAFNWSPQQQPAQVQQPNQQGGIGGLAQPTQQPSYQVVQAYQQPQPQAPAFGGGYTQKYYNRS